MTADHANGAVRISAVMPAYDAAPYLAASLAPLLAMQRRGEVGEVIVVDDGSTDATRSIAAELGARVIDSGGRMGPGGARNAAAAVATGDVLWFVDADVVVHEDAARQVLEVFRAADLVAAFGSYDETPPAKAFVSQYKNLLHRFHHQRLRGPVATFWAGCGAVRRRAFLDAGGFDAVAYPRPSIEDIDLGWRLALRGARIEPLPQLLGTHLKRWTWRGWLVTDIVHRALPWTKLILRGAGPARVLNVGWPERLRAGVALVLFGSIVGAAARLFSPWWCAPAALAALVANAELFGYFRRCRGIAFALAALAVHQLYYLYSSAVFAGCMLARAAATGAGADAAAHASRSTTPR